MNLNASIIDQRVHKLATDQRQSLNDALGTLSDEKAVSAAFVLLVMQMLLDLDLDEGLDALTEGGNDFGVDGLHIGSEQDGEFLVTLFQGKYKRKLEGQANFPEDGVQKALTAARYLFDPASSITLNKRLAVRVEDIRSRVRDGLLPRVRVILCNNGQRWNELAQAHVQRADLGDQVTLEHVNHDTLVGIMQSTKPVNETLRLSGKALVEDFDFSRVLVGKIGLTELAALVQRHGEKLLERNIRRYLGLSGNRVNEGIRATLLDPAERSHFYFYNNGITLTCSKFSYNALQGTDYQVRVEGLQIINGGQTSNTIARVLADLDLASQDHLDQAFVLLRLYELQDERTDFVSKVTYATNSQNPVDLRDLRANDEVQRRLDLSVAELGYTYRRKRTDGPTRPEDITSSVAAEAVLAVWRKLPHQAKFLAREHFGKLYDRIFSTKLSGAQLVIAVLVYRVAENRRKRPAPDAPDFIAYASCFLAMRSAQYLLRDMDLENPEQITHQNFSQAKSMLLQKGERYTDFAQKDIQQALSQLYGKGSVSLQRLSATFRRGDLIEILDQAPLRQRLSK